MTPSWQMRIGAEVDDRGTQFRVWSPTAQTIQVVLFSNRYEPTHTVPLDRDTEDPEVFTGRVDGAKAGVRYKYRIDNAGAFPDPASRYQPFGVHGPSEVVDTRNFSWSDDDWSGVSRDRLVLYEVHVGTATADGTFDSLITDFLPHVRELGVTAILLMPVAQFPGNRNWGYDGVNLFAPAAAYGGPEGFRRFVDAAHTAGLGVILDVVYNHIGPEGNYLREFCPYYFNPSAITPWGDGFNFDGRYSRSVREFFVANACYWVHEFHVDGLRLDSLGAMCDASDTHIVSEIRRRVTATTSRDRPFILIAETDSNDSNLVAPLEAGGVGLDAVYVDDFHHQIMVALTGDRSGYYIDYDGTTDDIVRTINQRWFYAGEYSEWRSDHIGNQADHLPARSFVYFTENHDQVGNRPGSERLGHLTDEATYRAVSALLLVLPYAPLLFMGQEWLASTPFYYFADFSDELAAAAEHSRLDQLDTLFPSVDVTPPAPQDPAAYALSKLKLEERSASEHRAVLTFYRDLLALRRERPGLYSERATCRSHRLSESALAVELGAPSGEDALLLVVAFKGNIHVDLRESSRGRPRQRLTWVGLLDSEDAVYSLDSTSSAINDVVFDMSGPRALVFGSP